jgi:hypothetical protein
VHNCVLKRIRASNPRNTKEFSVFPESGIRQFDVSIPGSHCWYSPTTATKDLKKKDVIIHFSVNYHCPTIQLLSLSCNTHATTLSCVPLSHYYIHQVTNMPLPCPVSHCPTIPLLHPSCNTHATTLSCVPLSHYPTVTSIM